MVDFNNLFINPEDRIIFALLIVVIILYICKNSEYFSGKKPVKSDIDGRVYRVLESYHPEGDNEQAAADKLAEINIYLQTLVDYMVDKYLVKGQGTEKEKAFVRRLANKYDPNTVTENRPTGAHNTSYVVNKGEQIAFCLREPGEDDSIHQSHILKFVALHEISHIGNEGLGHKNDFWAAFKFILDNAKEAGLYRPINYEKTPHRYCGIDVTYNPYFDNSLGEVS